MSRSLGIVTAALAAALGAAALPAALAGPRQPIEHLALSGGNFIKHSATAGCFTGSGLLGAGFPVPQGAMVTGATFHVIDDSSTAQIFAEFNRHDFISGGTFRLKTGSSGGTGTKTIDLVLDQGFVLPAGNAINLTAHVGSGTCLKGAEVHFIRNPGPQTDAAARSAPISATDLAPDGRPVAAAR